MEEVLDERGFIGRINKNEMGLEMGMSIIIYDCKGQENVVPHFCVFPYSKEWPKMENLIGKVKITQKKPEKVEDIYTLDDFSLSEEYKKAILQWADENNNGLKIKNWELVKMFWDMNQYTEVFSYDDRRNKYDC